MKRLVVIIVAVVAVFGGVVWLSSNKNTSMNGSTNTAASQTEFDKVQQAVAGGAKLYDVRTAEEFSSGHFQNAENWPLQNLQAGSYPNVAKDTKIYVYCHSGNRSGQSTELLKQAGYTNVTDLH